MSYFNLESYATSQRAEQLQSARMDAEYAELVSRANNSGMSPGAGGQISWGGGGSGSSGSGGSRTVSGSVDTSQATYDPWSKYRGAAGDKLASNEFGANDPSNFYRDKLQAMSSGEFSPDDPSYAWRFQQGQQATERSLASKGLLNSGNAAIELQQYGQGAASQEYGAQFTRMLQGLTGVSQQYDTQQQRLMSMAGINLDPSTGAKLNISQQDANTNARQADNAFQVGMANARNSGGRSGGTSQLESYQMNQNTAQEQALSSSLFFGRAGGVSSPSTMWGTGSIY
jgi:hypothetical protein